MAVTPWMVVLNKNPILNKIASPIVDVSYSCASASATPNRWQEDMLSRPMTVKEIHEMVEAFGKTAKMLRDAGVDGVEIHAVHEGYLLDQFTMENWNWREDEYGGSFENRFRFPVEIVQCIKRYAGEDFPVSLRYSVKSYTKTWGKGAVPGEEFVEWGRDMPESEKAIKYLGDAGYDFFNCDNGTYDAWYWAHPPQYMPDNCNLADVEHIKKFTDKPVACAGRMLPETAAEEIAAGRLDAVAIARQNLVDPDWIIKIQEGREDEIKPCIRCHNGCFNFAKYKGTANIQGLEDFFGDMDFKVGGTHKGITAIQVDIKVDGLTPAIIKEAFEKTRKARMYILDEIMLKAIPAPRAEVSKWAPKMLATKVPVDKIREVIGSGGKVIQKISAECDVKIDISEDGSVFVSGIDKEKAEQAINIINTIANDPEIGAIYRGKVVKIMNFGAFVEIAPGKDGLVHISKLDKSRVEKVEDVVSVGDEIVVKVMEIDDQGRINLSRKDALADIEAKKNAK